MLAGVVQATSGQRWAVAELWLNVLKVPVALAHSGGD
jgi:hypothetical protein